MPRPKGSKNRPKSVISYEIQAKGVRTKINAEQKTVDRLDYEVATLSADLRAKKKDLRAARTRLTHATKKIETIEARIAEEKRRGDVTKLLDSLLASGKTVDDLEEAINQM